MKRNASAVWQGDLKQGKGAISTASGTLSNTQYSFATRFENGVGTNPEELLAAAHAGCFAMAFSAQLGDAGLTAERIDVTATITLEKTEGGFAITESHLESEGKNPGRQSGRLRHSGRQRQGRLPGFQAVQHQDYTQRYASGLTTLDVGRLPAC